MGGLQKDITQETLAADTGMAASNLSLLESGTRQPNLDKIVKRASALETEPSELLRLAEAHAAGQLALEVTVKPK
jgi:transcriptional regulator with XRE-family HTH domain